MLITRYSIPLGIRTALLVLLALPSPAFAADEKAPACIAEKIDVEKLKQQNAQLLQQLMQAQFQVSQQQQQASKAEEERLQKLLPKQPEKK